MSESPTPVLDFAEALVLFMLAGAVLMALRADRTRRIPGVPATMMAVFLVSLAFIVLVRLVVPVNFNTAVNGTRNSSSGTPPPGSNVTLPNGTFGALPFSPPSWIAYLGLGIAVLVAIVLLAPALQRRLNPPAPEPAPTAEVRRSLESALRALAEENPTEARRIIIGLYARLLETVGPYLENLDTATPREIERVCVDRFGIGSTPAGELTRLFEEARYSSHPFTESQVGRARRALETALLHVKVRSYSGGA